MLVFSNGPRLPMWKNHGSPKDVVAHRLRTPIVRIDPCSLMNARQTLTVELSYISIPPCPPPYLIWNRDTKLIYPGQTWTHSVALAD